MFKSIFLSFIYLSCLSINANSMVENKPILKQKNNSIKNNLVPNFSIYSDIKLLPAKHAFGVFHLGLNKAVSENTNLFYNVSTSIFYRNHYIPSLKNNEMMASLNYVFTTGFFVGLYAKLGEANYQYQINNYISGFLVNSRTHKYNTTYTSIGIKEGKLWGSKSGKFAHEIAFNFGVNFLNCTKRDSLESPFVANSWFLGTSYRSDFYKGLPIVTGSYKRINIEFSYKLYFALGKKRNEVDNYNYSNKFSKPF